MPGSPLETQGDSATEGGSLTGGADAINDSNIAQDPDGCVQVAVRVRPMLPKEAGTTECIDVLSTKQGDNVIKCNVLQLGGSSGPKFTFDQVFGTATEQSQVYRDRVAPLVENCLEGYNATVLAYGQTGSGKTHTIMGGGLSTAMMQEDEQGVLPRAIRSIFQRLQKQQQNPPHSASTTGNGHQSTANDSCGMFEYVVRVQFLEIYGEEIRDLLNPRSQSSTDSKLSIRDIGNEEPEVVGATMHKVESAEEALLCLTSGMYRRVTASTAMNEGSSRSHAILSMVVEQSTIMHVDQMKHAATKAKSKGPGDSSIPSSKEHVQSKTSRFNFVDLAGSERQKRTQATGQRLQEGININKGLLVLGNVISALGDPKKRGKAFVPYRDSKLTRLLKGSLGGNHKTLMIACVSPSSSNMEESLNCLRYANRAKNIQNHAVVNLDSTSQLVADLKAKIQRLALDLIKVKSGKADECSFPMSVIESLAEGDDSYKMVATPSKSHNALSTTVAIEAEVEAKKLRAENESYRIQLESLSEGKNPADALQDAYMAKVSDYEREIARLKNDIQLKNDEMRSRSRGRRSQRTRSESPELSRLKSQMFGSMSKSFTLDAEVQAEEEAAKHLSEKYLKSDGEFLDNNDAGDHLNHSASTDASADLDADLFELSNSISAKEALIHQLQTTQEKFETMREFYEEKLREMQDIVAVKEAETEKLSDELKKLGAGHSRGHELAERLKEKQAQVAELKRKQSELSRLTNVASRNESQIARLKNDVREMKTKKIDLQKQIASERKTHLTEVKKMKKESMQKDRELNKAKREVSKKSQEASKAQKIAKTRLEQMNQLKVKYRDTEKRLRMKTVKQGVLKKAGLDPVIFGRRQPDGKENEKLTPKSGKRKADVDKLRDFFDRRVADVSRRENLAEKVAQEWEQHLELTIQKEEILQTDTDSQHESLQALESAIKYREERIRQLASKLGKRQKRNKEDPPTDDSIIFNSEFHEIVDAKALENGADTVAKVLFGMVVRERRRIASLARTASSLDEKVQETESALADKEAAFNAYVGEQRLDAAALAQNQQQHILSLMEMVKEGHTEESNTSMSSPRSSIKRRRSSSVEDGNSRLLILANERIDVLERQLNETQLAQNALQKHQEGEQSAVLKLEEKTKECEELLEEIDDLRAALRRIRSGVGIDGALDSTSVSTAGKSKRPRPNPRPSTKSRSGQSPSLTIDTELHSSDSEEEVPDWAEDIMADLAIIAEGKMPSSLLQSREVVEAEAKLGNNVFDRLTNPRGFTGVQKQRNTKTSRPARKINASVSSQNFDEKEKKNEKSTKRSKEKDPRNSDQAKREKDQRNPDQAKRNVFDRLLSPSNLTGTQKQRFNRIQDKKGKNLEKAIENQHVAVRGRSRVTEYESDSTEDHERDFTRNDHFFVQRRGSDLSETKHEVHSSSKNEDYSQLDVFERLNKTTTQAYKEKVHSNIAEKLLDDILSDDDTSVLEHEESPRFEPRLERVKEYSSQNVFERLQKTTTEAYAQKKNCAVEDDHLLDEILSDDDAHDLEHDGGPRYEPRLERVKEYSSQNVFERLQKTTTEAYATKKKNCAVEDDHVLGSPKRRERSNTSDSHGLKKRNASE